MRKKMSRQALIDLFPPLEPDKIDQDVVSNATRKGHKHIHKPAFKAKRVKMSPAEYRRKHKGARYGK